MTHEPLNLSVTLTPRSHSLISSYQCQLVLFLHQPSFTAMYHTTLHTTSVYLPSHKQENVPIGKHMRKMSKFILSLSYSNLHTCISIYTQHATKVILRIHQYLHWSILLLLLLLLLLTVLVQLVDLNNLCKQD